MFQKLLGVDNVLHTRDDTAGYVTDWTRNYKGGGAVVFPRSTDQVAQIVAYCCDHKIGLVVQGGNTGLVGGGVGTTDHNELILCMSKMNRIISLCTDSNVIIAEAGCVLQHLNSELADYDLMMPIDLGSKGQCQIGGNIATNAGGLNVIRYGSLHAHVLGLEVVQGSGQVLDMLRPFSKDNMGLHLVHLFIGSEGSLGIITKVAISVVSKPKYRSVVLAKLSSFDSVAKALRTARRQLGEALSAFEFMDATSLEAVHVAMPNLMQRVRPESLPARPKYDTNKHTELPPPATGDMGEVVVLIEGTSASSDISERLIQFVAELEEKDLCSSDAIMCQSEAQSEQIWAIRENIPTSLMMLARGPNLGGALVKFDVSLDLSNVQSFVREVKQQLLKEDFVVLGAAPFRDAINGIDAQPLVEFAAFGHAGDRNLHLNVLVRSTLPPFASQDVQQARNANILALKEALDKAVIMALSKLGGSLSAEHGVGQMKRKYVSLQRSHQELLAASAIKKHFDPSNILQPDKFLPQGYI